MEGVPVTVTTSLPDIIATAERSLLASRTGVLLLTVQFVVLAAYAVLLSAALLVEHRRIDTAMLRSRGAGAARIGGLALVEGLLLTVPATIAAPWLAAAALRAFNVAGPLTEIGLQIHPVVSGESYLAAGVAAAACLVALLLPALPTVRSFASVHGSVTRAETRSLGTRLGLDLALLAVAGLGLWQLRHYGAPLTRSVQGSLGIDPLLVATPAIGFVAGAILALRVIPILAALIERAAARGRGLVSSLGARQLSRRPLRYTRAALLLMLAMAMGVFAITYTWTWSASQRDQATFQVGADARVEPAGVVGGLPGWAWSRAYDACPALTARTPIDREPVPIVASEGAARSSGSMRRRAASVVVLRPDLSTTPLDELCGPWPPIDRRIEAVPLPGEPSALRRRRRPDDRRPAAAGDRRGDGRARDGAGRPGPVRGRGRRSWHRSSFATRTVICTGSKRASGRWVEVRIVLDVPLGDRGRRRTPSFAYPLELLAIDVELTPARRTRGDRGDVTVRGVERDRGWYRATGAAHARAWMAHHVVGLWPTAGRGRGPQCRDGAEGRDRDARVADHPRRRSLRSRDHRHVRSARARRGRCGADRGRRDRSVPRGDGAARSATSCRCRSPASIGEVVIIGRDPCVPDGGPSRPVMLMDLPDARTPALRGQRRRRLRRRNGGSRSTRRSTRRPSIASVTRRSAAARS